MFKPIYAVLLNPIILLLFREERNRGDLKIQFNRHVATGFGKQRRTSSTPSQAPKYVSVLVKKLSGGGEATSRRVPRRVRRTSRSSSAIAAGVCLSKKS